MKVRAKIADLCLFWRVGNIIEVAAPYLRNNRNFAEDEITRLPEDRLPDMGREKIIHQAPRPTEWGASSLSPLTWIGACPGKLPRRWN